MRHWRTSRSSIMRIDTGDVACKMSANLPRCHFLISSELKPHGPATRGESILLGPLWKKYWQTRTDVVDTSHARLAPRSMQSPVQCSLGVLRCGGGLCKPLLRQRGNRFQKIFATWYEDNSGPLTVNLNSSMVWIGCMLRSTEFPGEKEKSILCNLTSSELEMVIMMHLLPTSSHPMMQNQSYCLIVQSSPNILARPSGAVSIALPWVPRLSLPSGRSPPWASRCPWLRHFQVLLQVLSELQVFTYLGIVKWCANRYKAWINARTTMQNVWCTIVSVHLFP